ELLRRRRLGGSLRWESARASQSSRTAPRNGSLGLRSNETEANTLGKIPNANLGFPALPGASPAFPNHAAFRRVIGGGFPIQQSPSPVCEIAVDPATAIITNRSRSSRNSRQIVSSLSRGLRRVAYPPSACAIRCYFRPTRERCC